MSTSLWEFIGVRRETKSGSDSKVNDFIQQLFSSLENLFQFQLSDYNDIHELISYRQDLNDQQSYFWDWFNEIGLLKLKHVLETNLPEKEEISDLLEYRKMLLIMDIENGIMDSVFNSVADSITELDETITAISEQAASELWETHNFSKYFDDFVRVPNSECLNKRQWNFEFKNPAETQQDFCYYL